MSETGEAKLFMHGRSQAVRLPKAFRMPGTSVTVTRVGRGVLLEPKGQSKAEIDAIFEELRAFHDLPFMPEGREQPPMPPSIDLDADG